MQKDYTVFQIPSFAKAEARNFEATTESLATYRELNEISEEIEKWRLANS